MSDAPKVAGIFPIVPTRRCLTPIWLVGRKPVANLPDP